MLVYTPALMWVVSCISKGILSFMITGLKRNIPYVVQSIPETTFTGKWLADKIAEFVQRAFKHYTMPDFLWVEFWWTTIQPTQRRSQHCGRNTGQILPTTSFTHQTLITRRYLRQRLEAKSEPQKSTEINLPGTPPREYKAVGPFIALAVFADTTIAATKIYFPERERIFRAFWNSKLESTLPCEPFLGNAIVPGDGRVPYFRALLIGSKNGRHHLHSNAHQKPYSHFTTTLGHRVCLLRSYWAKISITFLSTAYKAIH